MKPSGYPVIHDWPKSPDRWVYHGHIFSAVRTGDLKYAVTENNNNNKHSKHESYDAYES